MRFAPEMLKALDIVGLFWLTRLFSLMEVSDNTDGVADWVFDPYSEESRPESVFQLQWDHATQPPFPWKVTPGA